MIAYSLLLLGSFLNVFLLGLNSQYVRDRKVAICFMISWGISVSQFTYIYIIANTPDIVLSFFIGSLGSSLGIVSSIYFYNYLSSRKTNE